MFSDSEKDYSYEEALEIAEEYGLENEIRHSINYCGATPAQALKDWDIYPYEDHFNEGTIKHFQD